MGPLIHIGSIAALLVCAELSGYNVSLEVCLASIIGGILMDGDKVLEVINNRLRQKKDKMPDITARCRILHSFFAFPLGIILSLTVYSWLPFFAVLLHISLDSFVPGVVKNDKNYPSHSRLKWIAIPFIERSWRTVTINWPVTYPPEFNWVYSKLSPTVGTILLFLSVLYWLLL